MSELDVRCFRCGRTPEEIPGYLSTLQSDAFDNMATAADLVAEGEGTYNPENGHFACDTCYIAIGQPANRFPAPNWVAP